MILVAGCSFLADFDRLASGSNIINLAKSGAGNEYIARSIVETIACDNDYDYVFALFSGIERVDIELSASLYKVQEPTYSHQELLNESAWIFSGGRLGTWCKNVSDSAIKRYIKMQYMDKDTKSLTNRSLYHVLTAYNALKLSGIPFDLGWIYDPWNTNNNINVLGHMDMSAPLYGAMPWYEFIPTYPYDWCKERDLISSDRFHPTQEGMSAWLDSVDLKHKI